MQMMLISLVALLLSSSYFASAISFNTDSELTLNGSDKKSRRTKSKTSSNNYGGKDRECIKETTFIPETAHSKCSLELQAILHTPENCAYQYLKRISAKIRAQLPPIFASMAAQNLNALTSIGNQYQVNTYLIPAYGYPLEASPEAVALSSYIYDSAFARNLLNFDGFSADSWNQVYNYQFILMSEDANELMVRISLPFANGPVGCRK
jgi:hypothetical protein